jgi:carbonic anhydrase
VWEWLMEGNERYVSGHKGSDRVVARATPEWRAPLSDGQHPLATVLACSDSRVDPVHIFGCGVGDLFVVRTAGNVVTDTVMGSIEFGALYAGAPVLIILGHEQCGAVKASVSRMCDPSTAPVAASCLHSLLAIIDPASEEAIERARTAGGLRSEDLKHVCSDKHTVVQDAVCIHAKNMREMIRDTCPRVGQAEAAGKIKVVSAVYSIATGRVRVLPD